MRDATNHPEYVDLGSAPHTLGTGQMMLAIASLVLLLSIGLKPATYLYGATTMLTIISRILYRGKRDPRLKGN